jgi:predicted RecB family nuclease
MKKTAGLFQLSASDLVGHLSCRHLTALDRAVAAGDIEPPSCWDPLLQALWERGLAHEQNYVEHLERAGFAVTRIDAVGPERKRAEQTQAAMRAGVQIIVQGTLVEDPWLGRIDILKRIEPPSRLGDWSYEVVDTKLARETKSGTILQLCLYSDLVAGVQGRLPELMSVIPPWSEFQPQVYRTGDFTAYYRLVKGRLEAAVAEDHADATYPEPNAHCDVCAWRQRCDERRRADDHLCLVAGIAKLQIGQLRRHGITTTKELSALSVPLPWKPERGSARAYERVREQARIQVEGREQGAAVYELLPPEPGFGLACLPEPCAGDVFLDLEGDPYVGEAGLEYLLGHVTLDAAALPRYTGRWAETRAEEKENFERFVDWVMARWQHHPDLHIYHFAPYEPAALKRLMGRYASREQAIDQMLRARLFVDLYRVVRQGIRASVESYSIKQLERFYGFRRQAALTEAGLALVKIQAALELGQPDRIDGELKAVVRDYNRDDCLSTLALRDWLETLRTQLVGSGTHIPRPAAGDGSPSESIGERQAKVEQLARRLAADVPADTAARTDEQQARWVLANILDFHRREDKAVWWEYFRLSDLSAEELLNERCAIAGLVFVDSVGGTPKAPVHRYLFPAQEVELRGGEDLKRRGGQAFGKLEAISLDHRTVDIKKRGDTAAEHSDAIFGHQIVPTQVLADALLRIGDAVAGHGLAGAGDYQVARNLLMRVLPCRGGLIRRSEQSAFQSALTIATTLDNDVLAIQGPPGAGKTFTAARMICALVADGERVGITATSHKVIRHLLDQTVEAAIASGLTFRAVQKQPDQSEATADWISSTNDNQDVFAALGSGSCQVAAGTAWLWARPEARRSVDVLFVDEAAQMSLANVLAISHAGRSLVLLGDPQQLDQPTQGSHPEGTDVSALTHLLAGHQTIPWDRGLFLEETWRLHPDICSFTSETFYEGRLRPRPNLGRQRIVSGGPLRGAGLRFLPVRHEGNQSSSPEEADKAFLLVRKLLDNGSSWIDPDGHEHPLRLDDVLIITPYNSQVFELKQRLRQARIGTVDKFQGQEAPIVIYSLATSTPAEAPHGMEFLYSLNRLNVATSRARCICVLVASPDLFEPECRTPRQMQLANAFCRYREMAETVELR